MKKLNLLITLCISTMMLCAQEVPVPSPYSEVMQRVGLTDVKVEYSRPGVKDRKIFGDLEAYGEVWRTGANAATKITFSTNASFGGQMVEAGTYSIMTVPGEENWEVMLNSNLKVTERSYDPEMNVVATEAQSMKNDMTETMEFSFQNVTSNSADLVFKWEETMWKVHIEVESQKLAEANIEAAIKELDNAYDVYYTAAKYYLDEKIDSEKALQWAKKSVELQEKFWNVYTLSLCYEAVGDKKMAIKTAENSLKLSKEANYAPYIKRNEENIAKWSK